MGCKNSVLPFTALIFLFVLSAGTSASAYDSLPLAKETGIILAPPESFGMENTPLDTSLAAPLPPSKSSSNKSLYRRIMHKASFWKLRYYFVAQNAINCDLFYGLVQDNPLTGRASVDFIFPNGCQCHGVAQVTYYPPLGGFAGQRGYIKAKCSDGRSLNGNFETLSLTTGGGTVTDSLGNGYEFTFGHTAEQAVHNVNLLRQKLHCPGCDAKDIELKVQGQILRRN